MIGAWSGLLLVVLGAVLAAPALVAVGIIVGLVWVARSPWARFELRGLTYERRLSAGRAVVGETIGLDLVVHNPKLLPVPWLEVEDFVSVEARVDGRELERSELPGFAILRTTWTVGPFERVTRRLRIVADRRGLYQLDATRLQVADLFAQRSEAREETGPRLHYRVVPRSLSVRAAVPVSLLPGATRTRRGLFEDPALFAGVRPYQPGDPLRRVHWKATARLHRPVSRRLDPAHAAELVIACDAQTVPGPFWLRHYDDDLVESLYTTAMSLARELVDSGVACGLAANGYGTLRQRSLYLPPSAASAQVVRIADELAALSRSASRPFAGLLAELGRRTPPATAVLALSARDPADFLPVLRRLAAMGRPVRLVALGPDAAVAVASARAAGIAAQRAVLEPDWRTADALALAD